jgi:hypothetical protein
MLVMARSASMISIRDPVELKSLRIELLRFVVEKLLVHETLVSLISRSRSVDAENMSDP